MQIVINIIHSLFLYLLIAKSFEIIYRTVSFFHLAHAISLTLGAYFVFAISQLGVFPFWISIVFSLVAGVVLMFLVNELVYSPLLKKGLDNWQLMIVSFGIYLVLQNVISMIWGDSTETFRTSSVSEGHPFLGGTITDVQIMTIVAGLFLVLLVELFFDKTQTGRRMKAVMSNPSLSDLYGISHIRVIRLSFCIGSGLAALAGILIAADIDMTPTMGFDWLVYGVVAMIIGGFGKTRHLVLGAVFLATAQYLAGHFVGGAWLKASAYLILVVFLFFRPYGFSGKQLKKMDV